MHPLIQILLCLSVVSGLAYLCSKNLRPLLGKIFLAFLTAFVAVALILGPVHKTFKEANSLGLELDQAELSLRMLTAFQAAQQNVSKAEATSQSHPGQAPPRVSQISHALISQCYGQVISALEKRAHTAPTDDKPDLLQAQIIIVCGDSGDITFSSKMHEAEHQLANSHDGSKRELGRALISIYTSDHLTVAQADQYHKLLQNSLPCGWYQNTALLHLLKASGQNRAFEELETSINKHALSFAQHIVGLLIVAMLAALIGIITIVIFLATESRQSAKEEQSTSPAPWSFLTTYGVLIGWIATQLITQSILTSCVKQPLKLLLEANSASTALATAAIYLLTIVPAILYIWWFACRPYGVSFFDAVKLKLRTPNAGPPKLIVAGVLTWCTALPVVLGCQLLALKFFNSQGSSNPVLSLVRDAAHAPGVAVIAIYFVILGVLAPFMEETLFRGFIYSSLRKKFGKFVAAGCSAILFAVAHFDPGGFMALFALGFLFALVFEKNQSLVPSMIAHGLWNSGTFTMVLLLFGTD